MRVNGRHYAGLPAPLGEVGALLEARAIHPGRSARNHLLSLAATHAIGSRRVDQVLDLVGLSDVAGERAGNFSLGTGQRLGIAAALQAISLRLAAGSGQSDEAAAWDAQAMGRPPRLPAKESIISAAVCVAAILSGCSAAASSAGSGLRTTAHSAEATLAFTVTGVHPVPPNGSQDTHAQTPTTSCDNATFAADHALGVKVARGFALASLPASADLLRHFLTGTGTEVHYGDGSLIAKKALASAAFRMVDREVREAIRSQLKAGRTHVRLSAAQLPAVAFESGTSDLYWGFRGTQGLTVAGSGGRENGRYVGTLSYVIRDSYGFPAGDTLDGFGPPMRYLQTACGAPQHAAGAHWFPDTITLTVLFSQPA